MLMEKLKEITQTIKDSDSMFDIEISLDLITMFKSPLGRNRLRKKLKEMYGTLEIEGSEDSSFYYRKIRENSDKELLYTLKFISLRNRMITSFIEGILYEQ